LPGTARIVTTAVSAIMISAEADTRTDGKGLARLSLTHEKTCGYTLLNCNNSYTIADMYGYA